MGVLSRRNIPEKERGNFDRSCAHKMQSNGFLCFHLARRDFRFEVAGENAWTLINLADLN